jgi:uncharacterized membrane protein YhaH (DUF805 family)
MGGLFSMQGRYNRAKYFWTSIAIGFVANVLAYLLGIIVGSSGGDTSTAQALSLFISLPTAVIVAFQVVKRLHDLDRPGSHYWLLLIPFYNIYLGLVILFQKGTVGDNQYGPDPLAGK